MSIFTSLITKTLQVPGETEHTITIRKLAPKHLEAAAQASQRQSLQHFLAMGGAEYMRQMRDLGGDEVVTKAVAADPLLQFHRVTLLQHGVTAWTYAQPLATDVFEDLDGDTAEWLAREILRLAKPSLFETADEAEASRKNDSAGSSVH